MCYKLRILEVPIYRDEGSVGDLEIKLKVYLNNFDSGDKSMTTAIATDEKIILKDGESKLLKINS